MAKIDQLFPILNEDQIHKLEQCRFPGATYETTRVGLTWQRAQTLKQVAEWLSKRGPIENAPGPLWAVGFSAALNMVTERLEALLQADDLEDVPAPEAQPAAGEEDSCLNE